MTEEEHRNHSVISKLNSFAIPTPKKIDRYLIQNLPSYIKENRIGTERDISDFHDDFEKNRTDLHELDRWRDVTKDRIKRLEHLLDKLETPEEGKQ